MLRLLFSRNRTWVAIGLLILAARLCSHTTNNTNPPAGFDATPPAWIIEYFETQKSDE